MLWTSLFLQRVTASIIVCTLRNRGKEMSRNFGSKGEITQLDERRAKVGEVGKRCEGGKECRHWAQVVSCRSSIHAEIRTSARVRIKSIFVKLVTHLLGASESVGQRMCTPHVNSSLCRYRLLQCAIVSWGSRLGLINTDTSIQWLHWSSVPWD